MNASIPRFLCAVAMVAVIPPTPADASAPGGRYVVTNGGTSSGTVYDSKTRLTWQQTTSSIPYTRADAKTYCAGVGSSLGGTGWRLPTLKELQSLVDYSQTTPPMIDSTTFPGTPSERFWSASPLVGSSSYAWYIDFHYGNTSNDVFVSNTYHVRCVR
jgi:hypothetical protein